MARSYSCQRAQVKQQAEDLPVLLSLLRSLAAQHVWVELLPLDRDLC